MRLCTLHVDAGDDDSLPPLLLVHGLLSSCNHWRANREALSRRFRLIWVDLPGHGLSPPGPTHDALRPWHLVATLEEIRTTLGIDRWAVCGQSFGAGLTLRYALTHPERVTAQIFTNAGTALRPPLGPEDMRALADRVATLRAGGAAALRQERFHPRFAKRFPLQDRNLLSRDADGIDAAAFADLLEAALPHLSVRDVLPRTQVPTLLINGYRERAFQPLRAWAEDALDGLTVVDLDGGHSINIEHPDGFNTAVLRFLQAACP